MKLKALTSIALSSSIALGAMAVTPSASAEVSANVAISNMYLWRGFNLSTDGGVVSGGIDYANESGLYAGVWTSSENGGTETDLYVGFSGEAGDFSYDVGYIWYLYPEDNDTVGDTKDLSETDFSEIMLGAGFADFSATLYISSDTLAGGTADDYNYLTLDYTVGNYNIAYGMWMYDKSTGIDDTHITLTYSYSDNLSFAVNFSQADDASGIEEDPLFAVTYSLPLGK